MATICFYLVIVLKVGPSLMKNRAAFELTRVIQVYNLVNIVANAYVLGVTLLGTNYGASCFICTKDIGYRYSIYFGYYYLKVRQKCEA